MSDRNFKFFNNNIKPIPHIIFLFRHNTYKQANIFLLV